jgi:hypothetical protein
MAHNEDNSPDYDDDQHVHSWNPINPLHMLLSLLINKAHHIQSTQYLGDCNPVSPRATLVLLSYRVLCLIY